MQQPIKHTQKKTKKSTPKKAKANTRRKHTQMYGTSKLETFFAHNFLDKINVNYVYEYMAEDIKRFYDFAIVAVPDDGMLITEEKNEIKALSQTKNNLRVLLLIEVDGNHWHPDTEKVKWEELSPIQKHNAMVDKVKNEWCLKRKIPLLRFWENDIKKNPSGVLKTLKDALENLSRRDKAKAGINKPHPRK